MAPEHWLSQEDVSWASHAPLLRAFDYLAAACFGAAAAVVTWMVVPSALPWGVEMLLGMLVGVASALPLLGLFSWILGGFEIVVMSAQVGMFAGMVGVMTNSATAGDVAFEGILMGLLVQILIHTADRSLRGEVETHD